MQLISLTTIMNKYSTYGRVTPAIKDLEVTLVILSTYRTVLMTFKPCLNAVFMEYMSTSR